jgi:arylsulfatase A-like enzyme/lysophospholipase L1-like esterase
MSKFSRLLLRYPGALLFLLASSLSATAVQEKPNVLFLFADDLSYEAVGIARKQGIDIETPNLDRLAQSGTCFTHAYNMGSWSPAVCVASRTMLMTGRSVWRAQQHLAEDVAAGRLWPLWMKQAGYFTWMSGKWHVNAPVEKAFEVVKNLRGGMPKDASGAYARPPAQGEDVWDAADQSLGGYWSGGKHWSEVTADDAIQFLQEGASTAKPFFMYVAFNAPHDPRQSPQSYLDRYPLERIQVPPSWLPEYPHAEAMNSGRELRDEKLAPFPRTEHAIKVHRREYFALITHLDAQIGRVLEALEKSGRADNTVVIFTADQGLSVGHHGLMGKQNAYEPATRVPFFISGKGIPAGKVVDKPIWVQDGMATTLELAGVARPDSVEFKSVLPLLKEPSATDDLEEAVYFAYLDAQRAVSSEGHKLILYPQAGVSRLFDLKHDPDEKHDLAGDVSLRPLMERLFAKMRQLQSRYSDALDLEKSFPRFVSQPTTREQKARKPNPAFGPVQDDPALPRVLIIGDSISIGYTVPVRKLLAGVANVHRIPTNGGPTKNGVANIDQWLGKKPWDVIHFNFGLHDLKHMEDGKRQVEIDDYEKNLRELVARMKQTGATLIWASTTPVPQGPLKPARTFGDEAIYNELAARVMKESGVRINELNAHITPKLNTLQKPQDVHFTEEGSEYLAGKVAAEIKAVLASKK